MISCRVQAGQGGVRGTGTQLHEIRCIQGESRAIICSMSMCSAGATRVRSLRAQNSGAGTSPSLAAFLPVWPTDCFKAFVCELFFDFGFGGVHLRIEYQNPVRPKRLSFDHERCW